MPLSAKELHTHSVVVVLLWEDDIIVGLELVRLFREEFGERAGKKSSLGM